MISKLSMYGLAAGLLLLIAAGFLIPIGTYTTQNFCLAEETSRVNTQRLALIRGQTINNAKTDGEGVRGCVLPIRYTLYIL